jgi:hypothetical protein
VIESGSLVGRHLLAGADGFDDRFGRLGLAEAFRDVLAVEQAGNVGEQPCLDARPTAGGKQQENELGPLLAGFECHSFVGAGESEYGPVDAIETPVWDRQTFAEVGTLMTGEASKAGRRIRAEPTTSAAMSHSMPAPSFGCPTDRTTPRRNRR